MTPLPDLMTPRDVMAHFQASRSWVQTHRDELGGFRIGGLLRFPRPAVLAYAASGATEPTPLRQPETVPPIQIDTRRLPPVNPVSKRDWGFTTARASTGGQR